jgi:hypothetical protein
MPQLGVDSNLAIAPDLPTGWKPGATQIKPASAGYESGLQLPVPRCRGFGIVPLRKTCILLN